MVENPQIAVLPPERIAPAVWDGVAPEGKRCPRLSRDWTDCAVETDPLGGTVRLVVVGPPADPFAIVPLVMFTANRRMMGGLPAPRWHIAACSVIALTVIALNVKLIIDVATGG